MAGTFNQSLQCTQDVFVGFQAPLPPVPLTTDVVGNDDVLDPSTNVVRESGSDSIIDIDVPEHNG